MDGDIAPLRALSLVARLQQALFYVDDAHGVGVVGDGRGAVAAAGLGGDDVPLQLVTLGKALGGSGALVLGRDDLVEHLAETARPYIYTTAVPPAMAAAALEAVRLARRDHWRRSKLADLIALAKKQPGKLSFGSSGVGGAHHLSGEMFREQAKIDIVHVPYKGGSLAATDLMGGQVLSMIETVPAAQGNIKAGKLRALAVTSPVRVDALPDLDVRHRGARQYAGAGHRPPER
ncbi:hypothetical protein G6F50_014851 [Rhizopus delemar]|uniref:Aminotransferase class I/classII domain-containing protein n=1 Tax=Rhizopus delemar TaxID=936053 RepID=A0A9P6Y299_9FUNG|nr:hypothetical protein G6F50_014851 [Rhizopus delemar]